MEKKLKKEEEEKRQKEMAFGGFQSQMNPGWMAYATGMPGFRPMGYGPSPYASNIPFQGGMPPMMGPMYQPRYPFGMAPRPLIPQVNLFFSNVSRSDLLKHLSVK